MEDKQIEKIYFSKNLRHLRELNDLSRNDLAAILEKPASKIGDWENGKSEPDLHVLSHIKNHFNLTLDQLIFSDMAGIYKLFLQKNIRLLVVDIDGVMTDGGMYYTESGDEFKKFNTKDGMAIKQLVKQGFIIGIISSGFNQKLIKRRAELLGVQHVYAGAEPKINVIHSWCKEHKYHMDEIAYIGDDVNDAEILQEAGIGACPADAVDSIKKYCTIVLSRKGGEGCVREFADKYLLKQK